MQTEALEEQQLEGRVSVRVVLVQLYLMEQAVCELLVVTL